MRGRKVVDATLEQRVEEVVFQGGHLAAKSKAIEVVSWVLLAVRFDASTCEQPHNGAAIGWMLPMPKKPLEAYGVRTLGFECAHSACRDNVEARWAISL